MDKNLNAIAMAVLTDAGKKLQALGLHCAVSPLSLPQGMIMSLHVADSQQAAAAAYVAQGRGGAQAHEASSAALFAAEVADVMAEEVIGKAARRPG